MPFDVFISHSSADKEIAFALCDGLEKAGLRCWIAPRNVTGGLDYADQISQAIQECPATLLVFSSHANESRHVKAEIDAAFGSGKILMPLRIEAVQPTMGMAHYLRNTHWLDALGKPTEAQTTHVAETLKSLIAGSTPPPAPPAAKSAPVSGKSSVSPALIAVVVLVVAALGAGAFFLLPKSKPESAAQTTTKTEETAEETASEYDSPEFEKVAGPFADAWIAMGDAVQAEAAFARTAWEEERAKALAKIFLKAGDRDKAMNLLSADEAPTKLEQYEMATLEAEVGAIKQALATLREAEKSTGADPDSTAPVDTRLAILDRASKESATLGLDQAEFDRLFEEADAFAAKDQETWAGVVQRLHLARIHAVTGDVESAKSALATEEKEITEAVNADSAPAVAEIFRVYLALKDLPGAETYFEQLSFSSDTDEAVVPLVQGLIQGKKMAEAENLAFSGRHPKSQRLVVEEYIKDEDLEAAAKVADSEHATGLALPVLLAAAYQEAEDAENAAAWMKKTREAALKDSSKAGQATGLAEIARIEAEAGYLEAADKTMDEAKGKIGLK